VEVLQMVVSTKESGKILIETKRLIIREMVQSDYDALCKILCDEEVMRTAYESAFNLE
jgi:[ribosomal protein S5]-alanine N-acetyltransferase